MRKILGLMLLAGMGAAHATPVSVNVNATVNWADGTLANELGNTITASFLFDLDPGAATSIDTNSSNNPLESFTAIYSFYSEGGPYIWSASSSGGGSTGSTNVSIFTYNDISDPVFNAGQPFDLISIHGYIGSGICPAEVIAVKGACDATDINPGDGLELSLDMAMPTDWFSGTNLPGYVPGFNSLLGTALYLDEIVGGVHAGEFDATVTSMTVSSVPEPETYAMLLAGLGLVGWAARRGKQAEV